MARYVLYARLIFVVCIAALLRLVRGARRPGWSFRFEMIVAVLREAITFGARRAMAGKSDKPIATRIPRSIAAQLTLETTT
ncbi:MAG: hypothetical protein ABW133_14710, partial [Polyangiaceae bacterium]